MDCLLYIANGLNLMTYAVKDILHLRLLSLMGVTCLALYFGSRPEPLTEVVCWNLIFLGLNLVHLGRILRDRDRDRSAGASDLAPVVGIGSAPPGHAISRVSAGVSE